MPKDSRAIQIMKAISMFDVDEDYSDREARDKLAILFREIVMSNEPKAQEFLTRFLTDIDNVIADMGIIDKPEEEPVDDVELPEPEEDLGGETDEFATEEPTTDDEVPAEEPEVEPEAGAGVEEEIPDDLLGAGYNPLIARANSFLYV